MPLPLLASRASRMVVVLVGLGRDATTGELPSVLREELGPNLELDIEEGDVEPTDDDLLRLASGHEARWVVAVRTDARGDVTFRTYTDDRHAWTTRRLHFDAADDDHERLRAEAFAIVAMVPDDAKLGERDTAPVQSTPAPPPLLAPSGTAAPAPVPMVLPPMTKTESSSAPLPSGREWRLDALAQVAVTDDGGGGIGAATSIAFAAFREAVFLRGTLFARESSVAAAQAHATIAGIRAGAAVGVEVLPRLRVGGRLEGAVIVESLSHFSGDELEPVRKTSVVPGCAAAGELEWRVASSAYIVLAPGVEAAFGTTRVYNHGLRAATLPPVRSVGEGGLRIAF